jgi:hypothetical protein
MKIVVDFVCTDVSGPAGKQHCNNRKQTIKERKNEKNSLLRGKFN